MLELDICRRLKAAGFPQPITTKPVEGRVYSYECTGRGDVFQDGVRCSPVHLEAGEEYHSSDQSEIDELVYCPNIEDLLRELPHNPPDPELENSPVRLMVYSVGDRWVAGYSPWEDYMRTEEEGTTAEEALANLWLALHAE